LLDGQSGDMGTQQNAGWCMSAYRTANLPGQCLGYTSAARR